MLQTERNHVSPYPEPEPAPPEASFSIHELISLVLGFLQRRWWILGVAAVVLTAIGEPVVIRLTPATYDATATVLIDNRGAKIDPKMGAIIDWGLIDAQFAIITSEDLRRRVADKLHLADDPEFGSPKPGLLRSILGAQQDTSEAARQERAVAALFGSMSARRSPANWVIEITCSSRNSERAAEIANAFADIYIDNDVQQKIELSKRYREWLLPLIKQVGDQLSEAQRSISAFKAANNIVEGQNGRTVNEQQIAELGAQQVAARQRSAEAKGKLARVEELIKANVDGAAVDATVDAVGTALYTTLRTKYLDKRKLERQWSIKYGSTHEAAVRLRGEMDELRAEMRDELKRVAETYRNDVESAKRAEESLQHEISRAQTQSVAANDALVTLRKMESDAKSLREIYDTRQKEYRERLQQESFPIPPARVLTRATPPVSKNHFKRLVMIAAVPAAGIGFGLVIALLLELLDDVFRTERQVQKVLGARCIAIVPQWNESEHRLTGSRLGAGPLPPRTIRRDQSPLWSVSSAPFSYFAESVRLIKAALDMGASTPLKVVGLTSAVPNEGKSTVAASLAQAIAQSGSRVILVDCDLRNPSLSASLAPLAECGLIEVVSEKAALKDVIWSDPATGMFFLPTVMKSRVAQTNEILASDAIKKLFETLRLMYEYVVVDLSPLAPVVDVQATTNLVDAYVFVVEWGRTHTSVVRRILDKAPGVTDSLLGVVLNKTDMRRLRGYDAHVSRYHEKGYYKY